MEENQILQMAGSTSSFFQDARLPQQRDVEGVAFPAVLVPSGGPPGPGGGIDDFLAAVRSERASRVEPLLREAGAVLLRGFPVRTAADFDRAVEAFGYEELPYVGGAAPRTNVVGRVFTANESPPDQKIPFHHEMAQVPTFPAKLFFFCEVEPKSGGETPIVLSHYVYKRMNEKFPEFVEKLEKHGLIYTPVLGEGDDPSSPIGRGWHSTFLSKDKSVAEERAAELGMTLEWTDDGVKTVMGPIPAVKWDEVRKRKIWFNSMVAAPPASHLLRPPPPFVTISVCGRRPAPISDSLPSATSHICRPPPPPAPSSIREHRSPPFSSELQRRCRLPPPPFSSYLHCLHLPSPPSASSPFLSPSTTTFVRSRNSAPSSHLAAAALSVDLDSNRRLLSSCQQICFGVLVSSRKAMVLRAVAARLASSSLCHHHVLQAALLAPTSTSPTAFLHSQATSFGYKQVREDEKSKLVGNVFSSVASSYDVMNDLMSGGLHRLWKDRLISKLNPFPGMKHLDVAGGTGDVAFRVVERIKSVSHRATQGTLTDLEEDTHIYVCDINPNMLDVGKKRAAEKGYNEEHCLSWVQGDAEALSFDDGSMDGYTIAFGIRNVTHIEKALSEAYRVLKKGGRFLCLELSHVDVPIFKDIYDVYSFSVIPAVGELVAGDRKSYQYLVESIRRFPKQEKFAQMIQEAGFERVEYENLVGGVVAIHSGLKL